MSWPRFWQRKGLTAFFLWPFSLLVAAIARCRLQRFTARRQPQAYRAQVIVVGNLVVGGSGKTPLILWLCQALQARGFKVGIISRGYGGAAPTWPQWVTAESDPKFVGDEPVMLAKALQVPIAVGPIRTAALALIEKNEPCDVIISDDGLQHFALQRDVELVVVDAQRQFGNQWCLPAGPLREPLNRLTKVDALIINGGTHLQLPQKWQRLLPPRYAMHLAPKQLRNLLYPQQTLPVEAFSTQTVQALAGIGNPARFFATLEPLVAGMQTRVFNDHHPFQLSDFDEFNSEKPLIMTAKDAVKCETFARQLTAKNWWALEVETEVDDQLVRLILQKLHTNQSTHPSASGFAPYKGSHDGSKTVRNSGVSGQ
ncbi:MAG: tetraacyldisaccharide 4'-kinase [Thiotrichales bacterium]|nr:tetraacyldisaccharide 4'-kinase [Thiotrichales bacterium]